MRNCELYHHGIRGQKWGVRKYQNIDGTYTEEGKKRYSSNKKSIAKKIAIGAGATLAAAGIAAYALSPKVRNVVNNSLKKLKTSSGDKISAYSEKGKKYCSEMFKQAKAGVKEGVKESAKNAPKTFVKGVATGVAVYGANQALKKMGMSNKKDKKNN